MIPKFETELSATQLERLITAEERKAQALVDLATTFVKLMSEASTFMAYITEVVEEERNR